LGGFSTVGVGTAGLVNTCVFGRVSSWAPYHRKFLPCPVRGMAALLSRQLPAQGEGAARGRDSNRCRSPLSHSVPQS